MFESASEILNQFVKAEDRQIWRFDIFSIDTARGDNPSDLYYLCNVRGSWFLAFETEYIFSLKEAADTAKELFEDDTFRLKHWITKKDQNGKIESISFEASGDRSTHDKLVCKMEGSYLQCAVIEVDYTGEKITRYDPTAYGFRT